MSKPAPKIQAETTAPTIHGLVINSGAKGTKKSPLLTMVPLKAIKVQENFNPRRTWDKTKHEELVASIKASGILEPLVLRPAADEGIFYVVAGEGRLRAAKTAELSEVPASIRTDLTDDLEAKAIAMAENSEDTRTALNPIEMGAAFAEFEAKEWSIAKIANSCHVNQAMVRRCLALNKAPENLKKKVKDGTMAAGTATALAGLDDDTRAKVQAKLAAGGGDASEARVKELSKAVAKEGVSDKVSAKGEKKVGRPAVSLAAQVIWRGGKAHGEALGQLAYQFAELSKSEETSGTQDWHEMRGAIAVLLYLRNDLTAPVLPGVTLAEGATRSVAETKVLATFDKYVAAESAKWLKAHPVKDQEAAAE